MSSPFERLERATEGLDAPFAVLDRAAFDANADDLVRRAAGTPIRLASKSVRSRPLIARALARPGFAGVLAVSVREALWLAEEHDDVVVAYPSADRGALARLAADERAAARVTVMVDDIAQLDLLATVATPGGPRVRVCLDLDASLRLAGGRLHLGARRSPVHTPADAAALAREVGRRGGLALVGVMAYEAQIAGLGDDRPGPAGHVLRAVQALSRRELAARRAAVVAAVRAVADLEFVNGGGTGSVESTVAEPAVTEVAAGSGLLAPTLFDSYRSFTPRPAAFFALPVVRRPSPRHVTVLGGGWIASGPTGADRSPRPVWPPGLALVPAEGAGEVQTPLSGPGAAALRVGDRVWFRHAKAGELCEHVNELHVVDADGSNGSNGVVGTVPTYRGEGRTLP